LIRPVFGLANLVWLENCYNFGAANWIKELDLPRDPAAL
jgi:hypothetical protein